MFGMINAPNILKGSAKLKDSGKEPKYIVEHQLLTYYQHCFCLWDFGINAINSTQLVSFSINVLHYWDWESQSVESKSNNNEVFIGAYAANIIQSECIKISRAPLLQCTFLQDKNKEFSSQTEQ